MLKDLIEISGVVFEILPYTEKRRTALEAINAEIDAFVEKDPSLTWDEVPKDVKVGFWERKAEVLLKPTKELPEGFYRSDEFEYTLLRKVESFFFASRIVL